jgi:ABC-type multidrug transport system fused ATPase/permease subunit
MSFFDTTPLGRILNRLNSDLSNIDEKLPETMGNVLETIFGIVSVLVVIGSVTPIFLILLIPLSFIYRYTQKLYLNSSREIQRIDSMSKSPIYSLFGECLHGASTIRAYDRTYELLNRNTKLVQLNSRAFNAWYTSNRWLSFRLEFVGAIVVFGACFFSILARGLASEAGLAISYSLQLTSFLNWMVRMATEVENAFVSVERCLEYTELPMEAARVGHHRPAETWPEKGQIKFQNLSLRYREGLPLILDNVNIEISSNEKIGIVGMRFCFLLIYIFLKIAL